MPSPPVYYKNPGLAAVLSFFWCGLGQNYNGQFAKGVFFVVAYAISVGLMWLLVGLVTTPLLWIYGMYDAYKSAHKINLELAQQAAEPQQPIG